MSWYVLYTKPQTEKKVASRLEKIGIEVYCPLITEKRQWSDRIKKVSLPLFKSYVFVRISDKERNKVFDVPGVVRYMFWLGKPAIVKDYEIHVIESWLNNETVEKINLEDFNPGDRLVLKEGAFKNEKAIIREIGQKKMRLILPKMGCTIVINTRELTG